MRFSALLLASFIGAGLAARADDAAKAIVEKARKATGWDKRKLNNSTWKEKGQFTAGGNSMTYDGTFHVTFPDKIRFDLEMKVGDQTMPFSCGLDGSKGWGKMMARVEDLPKEKLEYLQNEVYSMYVFSMMTLLDDKAFELTKIDDATLDGKKCAGISVTKKDKPTIKLWYDAETGLPAKLEYKVKDEFDGWKEATDEMFPTEWADDTDSKSFKKMKILRNGKPMIESEMSEYKMPEKVDPKLYEKP